MKPKIYISSFRTGPDATKKQQMLFATDTAYALSEGYELIQDSKGIVFYIIDEHNIVEFDDTEDSLQAEPTQVNFNTEELIKTSVTSLYGLTESEDPEITPLSTPAAIDKIINNALNQSVPLRTTQVNYLIKLAQLKQLLGV